MSAVPEGLPDERPKDPEAKDKRLAGAAPR